MDRPCVLVVDDDPAMREMLACLLDRLGYAAQTAIDAEEALFALEARRFHAVVCDLHMPRRDGFGLARVLRRIRPDVPLVLISSFAGPDTAAEAVRAGAGAFLAKPFSSAALREAIEAAKVALASGSSSPGADRPSPARGRPGRP
jgi:CheY-like chemotaxis protein